MTLQNIWEPCNLYISYPLLSSSFSAARLVVPWSAMRAWRSVRVQQRWRAVLETDVLHFLLNMRTLILMLNPAYLRLYVINHMAVFPPASHHLNQAAVTQISATLLWPIWCPWALLSSCLWCLSTFLNSDWVLQMYYQAWRNKKLYNPHFFHSMGKLFHPLIKELLLFLEPYFFFLSNEELDYSQVFTAICVPVKEIQSLFVLMKIVTGTESDIDLIIQHML